MSPGTPDFSPEQALLLAVLRADTATIEKYPPSDPTWHRILPLADAHRIPSLAGARLQALPEFISAVPPEVQEDSRTRLRNASQVSFLMTQKLERYIEVLEGESIPTVVLKGASLARTVYPSPEQRRFSDIDFLVARENVDRALRVLKEHGLHSVLGPEQDRHYTRWHFHRILTDGRGTYLELHWELARPQSPFHLPGVGVMARSFLMDNRVPRHEALEDQLLHAAAQFLSEGVCGLLRICDTDVIIRHTGDSLDWDGITRRGRDGLLAPTLDLMLRLSRRLLDTPWPNPANLLLTPRSVFMGLDPLRPSHFVLTPSTVRHTGYAHLLRFWLLPGARLTVLRYTLFGDPRDKTRPPLDSAPAPTMASRAGLLLKRTLIVLRLVGIQLLAMIRGRRDHLTRS